MPTRPPFPKNLKLAPNPAATHAVALQYAEGSSAAPKLTAKGKNELAARIIDIAQEHNIPITTDADLVELLDKVEVGAEIPLEVYAVVAEIFAYIYKMNQTKPA